MSIVVRTSDDRTLTLSGDLIRIGSSERSAIRFAIGEVAPEHAELQKIGGRWLVRSACDGQIRVEGQSPARMTWIKPGDRIHLTSAGVWFIFEPSPQSTASTASTFQSASADKLTDSEVSDRPRGERRTAPSNSFAVRAGIAAAAVCIILICGLVWARGFSDTEADPVAANNGARADVGVQDADPLEEDEQVVVDNVSRRLLIGYEVAGQRMLLGQCWALDTTTIASSAILLSELKQAGTQITVFVHSGEPGTGVVYVDAGSIRFPSGFDMADAGTLHSAVAVATLREELHSIPDLSYPKEWVPESDLKEGLLVTQYGFNVPLSDSAAIEFDLTSPPPPQAHVGQINYSPDHSPRTVRVKFPEWSSDKTILEGSLVHDESGRILGTLASGNQDSQEFYLIHADRLRELQR